MRTALIYLIFLSGCAAQASQHPMPIPARLVEWVKVDPSEIDQVCRDKSRAVLVYGRINGCSVKTANGCRIYAPDFKEDQGTPMAVFGHELKHCFDGDWHESNQVVR